MEKIRNFCIIAHIDHGKSTLADRLLEITGTVEKRAMKEQYLDSMDLERERGITIKMAPVRMNYELGIGNNDSEKKSNSQFAIPNSSFILNLIDTPGHSDFSYEVSRALTAVEGAVLLVDATQGIQAQTLANFHSAQKAGLTIIGAVNKIDMHPPGLEAVVDDVARLVGIPRDEVHRISGKTGEGVAELLRAVIEKVPAPTRREGERAALIFDSLYDDHKGIIAFVRIFSGAFRAGEEVRLMRAGEKLKIKELGALVPKMQSRETLDVGEIGYIATGIKDPDKLKIGDTIGPAVGGDALPGYREPQPVVFVAVYPHEDSDYDDLKVALYRLKLNDASFTFEPDMSEVLGRGFKCGFLGRLHFEIITQRLEREFNLKTVNSFPSVAYEVKQRGEWQTVQNPKDFPDDYEDVRQPIVHLEILTPARFLGEVLSLQSQFRFSGITTDNFGDYIIVTTKLPLSELVSDFDDRLKSVSQGYASFSYELSEPMPADLIKLEILIANEVVPGLTRVIFREDADREGRKMVERLKDLLPKQQFTQALQARAYGRIIARENIAALKKDVAGYLYGGDRTRKMKLWKKQARGKERLKRTGRVSLSPEVFRELLKK